MKSDMLFAFTPPEVATRSVCGGLRSKPGLRNLRKTAPLFAPTHRYMVASRGGLFEPLARWFV